MVRAVATCAATTSKEITMSEPWDKTQQMAKDAGTAVSDAGKAVADSTAEMPRSCSQA